MGWPVKPLGELCEFRNGLWKGKKPPFQEVTVIRNTNFTKGCELDLQDVAVLEVELKQYQSRKLEFGDLILEKSGGGPNQPVGRIVKFEVPDGDYSFSNFTSIVRVKDTSRLDYSFLHKFLFYLYEIGATESLQRQSTGIRNLHLKEYKEIMIPIPALEEQKRIVAILDEAFADIDKARELTEKNLKNARELFESYLRVVFDDAVSKFPKKAWKDALDIRSGRNQKEVETPDGSYPIVGSAGKTMGFANAYICEAGTTIIGRKGTINNPIFMEQAFWNVDTAFGLHAGEKLNKKFLYYFCRSFDFTSRDKGSGRPSLVKKDLLEMKMPLPPLEVQKQITLKLESLELEKLKLEAIYKEKQRKIEQLRYALLVNIFDDRLAN